MGRKSIEGRNLGRSEKVEARSNKRQIHFPKSSPILVTTSSSVPTPQQLLAIGDAPIIIVLRYSCCPIDRAVVKATT
jgi:hypothetical protein